MAKTDLIIPETRAHEWKIIWTGKKMLYDTKMEQGHV